MSTIAIVMLVVFIIVIWGGLALAIVHLLKHDDDTSGDLGTAAEHANEKLYEIERQH